MLLVKLPQFLRIMKVLNRFPGIITVRVLFLLNKIFPLTIIY